MKNEQSDQRPIARVGVIGAGRRGALYFNAIPDDVDVRIVAIADPSVSSSQAFAKRFADGQDVSYYEDGLEMLANEDLDAVIVASPNAEHVPYAVESMSQSLTLMLEKPVATTVDDLAALWRAYQDSDSGHTLVGFVLRYTPFYSAVRDIVRSGRLGEILSIEASENINTRLSLTQHRGWRHDTAKSGGWMVEKCCHDFDVLGYLIDSRPSRIYSMASAKHFRPRPDEEQLGRFQPDPETDHVEPDNPGSDVAQHSPYSPSNLPDRQVATLEFENGTLATFTAVMAQPKTTRRLRIFGTEGLLEGDIRSDTIVLSFPDPAGSAEFAVEEIPVDPGSPQNHYGGDAVLGDAFWHLAAGVEGATPLRAGLRDGIDGVLAAIALQRSAATGQPVEMDDLRREVFGDLAGDLGAPSAAHTG